MVVIQVQTTEQEFDDQYDKVMIATGAYAVVPPFDNKNLVNIFTIKSLQDGLALKEMEMSPDYKRVVVTNYYPDQVDIHVKLIYDAETRVILDGQIIGKQGSVLRVDVLAAAIHNKMTTEE
ncbi:Pyridine nucleotide-disulfide oxidoreductase [Brevibacillus laterosporus]|nr:Pyridine nucleotide-disulfide oxidoreductase [Brevibacillus laterosporus]